MSGSLHGRRGPSNAHTNAQFVYGRLTDAGLPFRLVTLGDAGIIIGSAASHESLAQALAPAPVSPRGPNRWVVNCLGLDTESEGSS